jgi:phage terminase small subunit
MGVRVSRRARLSLSRTLTARRIRFVEEYLIDLNSTRAATAAGYSQKNADVIGPRLLANGAVRTAIEKAQQARSQGTGLTQDRVLYELEHLAFSNIDHYLVNDHGRLTLREGAPAHALRAIARVRHRKTTKTVGDAVITDCETELVLWDKPTMLRLAGRHVGLFTDRLDNNTLLGKDGRPAKPFATRR